MHITGIHFERRFIPKDEVDRKPSHEELAAQIAEFEARGGKVKEIPSGVSSKNADKALAQFNTDYELHRKRGQDRRHNRGKSNDQ